MSGEWVDKKVNHRHDLPNWNDTNRVKPGSTWKCDCGTVFELQVINKTVGLIFKRNETDRYWVSETEKFLIYDYWGFGDYL